MNADDALLQLLKSFAFQTPLMLIEFAGIVLALVRYRREPVAMRLVLVSLVWMLTSNGLFTVIYALMPRWMFNGGGMDLEMAFGCLSVAHHFCAAIGYGLLIAAAFVGRGPAPKCQNQSD